MKINFCITKISEHSNNESCILFIIPELWLDLIDDIWQKSSFIITWLRFSTHNSNKDALLNIKAIHSSAFVVVCTFIICTKHPNKPLDFAILIYNKTKQKDFYHLKHWCIMYAIAELWSYRGIPLLATLLLS